MGRLSGKLLFALAFVAGVCLGWFIKFPPMDSSSAASWAQAIGTVAAIVGAVWLALYQIDHTSRAEQKQETERVLRAYGLLRSVVMRLVSATQSAAFHIKHRQSEEVASMRQKRYDEFAQIFNALNELPVHVLPDFDAVSGLLDARQLALEVTGFAQEYAKDPGYFGEVDTRHEPWIKFNERATEIEESLQEAAKYIRLGIMR